MENVLLRADYTCRRERRKGEFVKNGKIFVGKVPKWETYDLRFSRACRADFARCQTTTGNGMASLILQVTRVSKSSKWAPNHDSENSRLSCSYDSSYLVLLRPSGAGTNIYNAL